MCGVCLRVSRVWVCVCVYVDIASGEHRSEIILLFSNLVENIILSFFDLARVTTFFMYSIHSSLSTLVILSYFFVSFCLRLSLSHYAAAKKCEYYLRIWGDYYTIIYYTIEILYYIQYNTRRRYNDTMPV